MKKPGCEIALGHKPLLIIISGPSGAGKDAVLALMKESDITFERIITVTTRPQRAMERDKVDYYFVTTAKFQDMREHGELLEWAQVYGNWYGVPKEAVKGALQKGRDVIIKVDVQGAATIKKIVPQSILIYLVTPSAGELENRLKQRSTESSADLALRTKIAAEELKQLALFDYVVINKPGEIAQAVSDILAIITAEKCRVTHREVASL